MIFDSVLDNDHSFSKEDEEMLTLMDYEKYIHSILLMTCKHRIFNSNADWMKSFCAMGCKCARICIDIEDIFRCFCFGGKHGQSFGKGVLMKC